jgi:hypothetical protein
MLFLLQLARLKMCHSVLNSGTINTLLHHERTV